MPWIRTVIRIGVGNEEEYRCDHCLRTFFNVTMSGRSPKRNSYCSVACRSEHRRIRQKNRRNERSSRRLNIEMGYPY